MPERIFLKIDTGVRKQSLFTVITASRNGAFRQIESRGWRWSQASRCPFPQVTVTVVSAFVGMLEDKAARYGRTFARIDRWFPSSELCSRCGTVATAMPLNVREWACPCGAIHDRDVNAARNVLAEGRRTVAAGRKPAAETRREAETLNACGGDVRPPLAVADADEAGSHRGAA